MKGGGGRGGGGGGGGGEEGGGVEGQRLHTEGRDIKARWVLTFFGKIDLLSHAIFDHVFVLKVDIRDH